MNIREYKLIYMSHFVTLTLEDDHSADCTFHIHQKQKLFLQEQVVQKCTKMQIFWNVTQCWTSYRSFKWPLCLRHIRNHSPNALSSPRRLSSLAELLNLKICTNASINMLTAYVVLFFHESGPCGVTYH